MTARISSRVKSGCLAIRAKIQSECSSNGETLPPLRFGAALPVSPQRWHHRITELTPTLKISAISRRDAPLSTASTARSRKSVEYGLGIDLAPQANQFPQIRLGDSGWESLRFNADGKCSKFKIVTGYPGGNDVTLAMERGEVKGRCGWSWSSVVSTHKRWIDDKSITVLVQLSLAKHPDLSDVPLVMDFAKSEDQQQIFKLIFARQVMGRPYLAPPGVPKERADALRKAFMDTMKDPEFLSDAEKSQLEINPVSGAEVEQLVKDIYQTPKALADKAAEYIRH